jgi:hypothetical protein
MSALILAGQKSLNKRTTTPESSETSVEQGTVVDKDVDLLEQIGYKQVCKALKMFYMVIRLTTRRNFVVNSQDGQLSHTQLLSWEC